MINGNVYLSLRLETGRRILRLDRKAHVLAFDVQEIGLPTDWTVSVLGVRHTYKKPYLSQSHVISY